MRYREYSSTTDQFSSPDPLGLAGGDPNLRRYVGNDPLTLVDPIGLIGINVDFNFGGFSAGAFGGLTAGVQVGSAADGNPAIVPYWGAVSPNPIDPIPHPELPGISASLDDVNPNSTSGSVTGNFGGLTISRSLPFKPGIGGTGVGVTFPGWGANASVIHTGPNIAGWIPSWFFTPVPYPPYWPPPPGGPCTFSSSASMDSISAITIMCRLGPLQLSAFQECCAPARQWRAQSPGSASGHFQFHRAFWSRGIATRSSTNSVSRASMRPGTQVVGRPAQVVRRPTRLPQWTTPMTMPTTPTMMMMMTMRLSLHSI